MRIATVSDLHTDFAENREVFVALATAIHAKKTDLVIVAGDVSHEDDRIDRALRAMAAVAPRVVYLPGNHDLWRVDLPEGQTFDTWQRYRVDLKTVAETAGAHYLPAAPLVIDDVAIVGTCGWYDYSFVEPWVREQLGQAALETKKLGAIGWSDANYVSFRDASGALMPDPEVARIMASELEAQLAQVESDPAVRSVVAATHHQPFREVVRRSGTLPWEFFTAFMGSEGLGRAIARTPKVKNVVFGHSHIVAEHQIEGRRVYGTALGYPRERRGLDLDRVVATRIGFIDT